MFLQFQKPQNPSSWRRRYDSEGPRLRQLGFEKPEQLSILGTERQCQKLWHWLAKILGTVDASVHTSFCPAPSSSPPVTEWESRVASRSCQNLGRTTMINETNVSRCDLAPNPVSGALNEFWLARSYYARKLAITMLDNRCWRPVLKQRSAHNS